MSITAKKLNLVFVGLFIVAVLLIETWLRLTGIHPGYRYGSIEEVDSLQVLPAYFTDANGIQKISPYGASALNAYAAGTEKLSVENISSHQLENDLSSVAFDFYCLHNEYTGEQSELLRDTLGISSEPEERAGNISSYNSSELRKKLTAIKQSAIPGSFDTVLLNYRQAPINNSGFRGIPFSARVEGKKRILLLGDSHTWGRNAYPCFNSFADILLSRGYLVYNTGIVSTDPVQYLAVLNAYMDSVQPHTVVLNFYVNDKMAFHHAPTECYHHTNAGLLSAYPNNTYLNALQAYTCEIQQSKIPAVNWFNRFCSVTAIGTQFWCFLQRHNWVSSYNPATETCCPKGVPDAPFPVSAKYIQQVREVCRSRGIDCIIAALPNIYTYSDPYPSVSYQQLFDTIPFYEIKTLHPSDYSTLPYDDHLVNSGHRKYADFLDTLLQQQLK